MDMPTIVIITLIICFVVTLVGVVFGGIWFLLKPTIGGIENDER